ncbi:helix-turn-helix domain-containing protein [Paenibacillus sp. MBLB4367]|uniref:helix-turn-helix domain-containing protein n=1 Tax=Paenibacillus sp. MBLB4367 TaxID=3384767 RepID=UPI0039080109
MLNVSPGDFVVKSAFAKIVCEPAWKWQKREKPLQNYDLFYVWSGEGEVVLNGIPHDVRNGSCFLFRPGDETTATHNAQKPLVLTYIHFDILTVPLEVPKPYRVLPEPESTEVERLLTRYVRLFLGEGFAAKEEAQLVLKQLMIHLLRHDRNEADDKGIEGLAPLQRSKRPGEGSIQQKEAIREVANYVQLHAGKPHRLEDLAARANLSPRYFSAKFKELIGESVQDYVIRTRLERAEHLLRYAGMSVSEVAGALGYRDVFFFSRQFKQHTGKSPSELR